ncbi:MAG TPA: type VI secretion protein IcmF/TssM N-terminal domain-containing protein [Orrella sp.]
MSKILTFLLVIVLLALLGVLSWMLVLYLDWPVWGAFAVFFGVLGLYFAIKAAKRFFLISRSKSKLLAAQRADAMASAQKVDFKHVLNQQVKAALGLLKGSQLRRFGNPVYVLPWYLVMGESGAGKTTAISRSRLMPMMRESLAGTDITQTANCDWWFFSEAVVIDTAGRYVSPDGSELDQQEWDYLLELFAKYRSREGINGLVVVIDAPLLLSGDMQAIERRGQSLRDRIDQVMRLFEKRVPIYVMISKSDQIYGFTGWANGLSDAESMQAMGYLSDERTDIADEQVFAQEAIDTLRARLESLRLDLSMREADLTPEMLLFPGELARLKPGLQRFLQATFGANPYLEHPFLRGLFLTSARQQPPEPSRLGELITAAASENGSDQGRRGLFIHDIFSRILPIERGIALPGQIVSRWRHVTANLALVSWLSLCLAALVFLVVSYQSTSATINRLASIIPSEFSSEPTNERKPDIDRLTTGLVFVKLILQAEQDWRTRWLAFSPEVTRLEDKLKDTYVRQFRRLQDTEGSGPLDVKTLLEASEPAQQAYGMLALARYVNIVQARVNGASYSDLLAMPQVPKAVLQTVAPSIDGNVLSGFNELLAAAVGWSEPDDPYLTEVLRLDRATLLAQLSKTNQMQWLVDWANTLPDLSPISMADFWNPDGSSATGYQIKAGLTLAGQQRIDGFISELNQALQGSEGLNRQVDAFRRWYMERRLNAWRDMALGIEQGESLVPTEPQYRRVISSIGTQNSPFNLFLNRLTQEFQALPSSQSPSWLEFARYYTNLIVQAKRTQGSSFVNSMNTISAVNNVAGQAMRASVEQGQNLVPSAITRARTDISLFESYLQARDKAVVDVLGGSGAAMKMTSSYFGAAQAQQSADGGNPVLLDMSKQMAAFRKNSRFNTAQDEVIWQVIEAPMNTINYYAFQQASCNIQDTWARDVMWKTHLAINPEEVSEQLFGDQGSVWSFVDGPAKSFVNRLGGAFVPATKDGAQFPFAAGFIQFLNQAVSSRVSEVVRQKLSKASIQKSAKLTLAAMPLGVNPGAKARPYAALLFVQCDQQQIELSNVNMQASDSFEWSPGKCGETRLEIELDNMTLVKRYPGPTGLATFVEEFADGARVFTPADFPAAMKQLDDLNVKEIAVRYEMSGRQEVLDLAKDYDFVMQQTTPSTEPAVSRLTIDVPERAGRCWSAPSAATEALQVPRLIEKEAEKKANPPPKPPEPPLPPIEPLKPAPTKEIVVQSGQTLFSIAKQYRVDLQILKALNDLSSDKILVGQKLLVPIWQNQPGDAATTN